MVGGGDVAVLIPVTGRGRADPVPRHPQAAAIWAASGGFVSPNLELDLSVYPDPISRSIAASLLQAGDDFRFSLSDLPRPASAGPRAQGMRKSLQQFLVSRDVSGTAAQLEQEARKAYPA